MKRRSSYGCLFYGVAIFVALPIFVCLVAFLLIAGRERSAKQKLNAQLEKLVAQGLPIDDATLLTFTNSLTSPEDTKEWISVLALLTSDDFAKTTRGVPMFDTEAAEPLEVPAPDTPALVKPDLDKPDLDKPDLDKPDLDKPDLGQTDLETPTVLWAQEQATREFLAKWSELRGRVTRLSLKQLQPGAKPVRFLTEFKSINTLLPQTQNMRSAARMLMLNGQVAVYDRNSATARLSIESLFGCSRTVSGEPILVSQLVCSSIESMGVSLLRSALEHDVLSEKDLLLLLPRVLDGIHVRGQWKLAMQGERAMMLPVFADPELVGDVGIKRLTGTSPDALYYLDVLEKVLAVPDKDFDEFLAGLDQVEFGLRRKMGGNLIERYDSIVTNLTMPAVKAAGSAYVRDAVQRRLAAICIGVRLYEKRLGKAPSSLDELKKLELGTSSLDPDVLRPPGGKRFGYKVEESKVLVWGFDFNNVSSTPDVPPEVGGDLMQPMDQMHWLWTLDAPKQVE